MTLLRPSEIVDRNPGIKKHWNASIIGYLHSFGLVRGKKIHRGCLVNESDVLKVFRLRMNGEQTDH